MNDISIIQEGTWLYDGQIPVGIRVVSCSMRWGTGDWQDPPEIRNDLKVAGFDVQWASPNSPAEYSTHASANFATLQVAIEYAEGVAWAQKTLRWSTKAE